MTSSAASPITSHTDYEASRLADLINRDDGYHYTVNPELASIVIGPRAFYLLDWSDNADQSIVTGTVWAQRASEYDPEEVQAQGYWIVQTTAEIIATSALPA